MSKKTNIIQEGIVAWETIKDALREQVELAQPNFEKKKISLDY